MAQICNCTGCPGNPNTSAGVVPSYDGYKGYTIDNSVGTLIVWFFVIFVVTLLAIYALEPSFVYKRDIRVIDNGKVVLTAFVFALFLTIFIFLIRIFTC